MYDFFLRILAGASTPEWNGAPPTKESATADGQRRPVNFERNYPHTEVIYICTFAHAISAANPFPLISGAHITKMIHGTKRVIDRLIAMER